MEKIIQFVTSDEKTAFEIIKALKELDNNSEISLGEYYVFQKDSEGKVALKDEQSDPVEGTFFGTLAGGLFGAFFGPAGILIGSSFGLLAGSTLDIVSISNKDRYVDELTKGLKANSVTIIAHVIEDWTTPIDTMIAEKAEIRRLNVDEEIDKQIDEQIDSINRNIEDFEEKIKNRLGDARSEYLERIDELKKRRENLKKQYKDKAESEKNTYKKWLKGVKDKLKV